MPIVGFNATPLNGDDILAELSFDNGENFETIVCLIRQGTEVSRNVTEVNTQCGLLLGKGVLNRNHPVEGAVNISTAAGYLSYAKLQEMINDWIPAIFRQQHGVEGANLLNQGSVYLTELSLDSPVDNIVTFTGTLRGWGSWATTPIPEEEEEEGGGGGG